MVNQKEAGPVGPQTKTNRNSPVRQNPNNLQTWLLFAFGVIFVTAILVLATIEKNPTPQMTWTYTVVLALAGAGVGAMLPGFLEVRFDIQLQHKGLVRAGGALAVFVIILFSHTSISKYVPTYVDPSVSPLTSTGQFLTALDSGNAQESWNLLDDQGKNAVNNSESEWLELFNAERKPLGSVENRTGPVYEAKELSPPGSPPGYYETLVYRTTFQNSPRPYMEQVTLRATSSDSWGITSYLLSPSTS